MSDILTLCAVKMPLFTLERERERERESLGWGGGRSIAGDLTF